MPGLNQKIRTLILCCGAIALCLWIFKSTEPQVSFDSSKGIEPETLNLEEQLLVTTPVVTTELTIVSDQPVPEENEIVDQVQQEDGLSQQLVQVEPLDLAQESVELDEIDPQEQVSLLKVDINYMIEQWQEAWQSGDADRYLGFYSAQFTPSGDLSLTQWQQQRRVRVTSDNPVTLSLSNFEVELVDDNQKATVSFDQLYQSSTFEQTSRKQLVLVRDEEWRIITERELN